MQYILSLSSVHSSLPPGHPLLIAIVGKNISLRVGLFGDVR
jgi:hypothetical protein